MMNRMSLVKSKQVIFIIRLNALVLLTNQIHLVFSFILESLIGKLNSEKITDILQQNTAVLQQYQLETGDIWRLLNNHQVVSLPNGISINPNDPSFTHMNEPPKTIAILGDTDNARYKFKYRS